MNTAPTTHPKERVALIHIQQDGLGKIVVCRCVEVMCRDSGIEHKPLRDVVKVLVALLIHFVERCQMRVQKREYCWARCRDFTGRGGRICQAHGRCALVALFQGSAPAEMCSTIKTYHETHDTCSDRGGLHLSKGVLDLTLHDDEEQHSNQLLRD